MEGQPPPLFPLLVASRRVSSKGGIGLIFCALVLGGILGEGGGRRFRSEFESSAKPYCDARAVQSWRNPTFPSKHVRRVPSSEHVFVNLPQHMYLCWLLVEHRQAGGPSSCDVKHDWHL